MQHHAVPEMHPHRTRQAGPDVGHSILHACPHLLTKLCRHCVQADVSPSFVISVGLLSASVMAVHASAADATASFE